MKRRQFMGAGAAMSAFTILPSGLLANSPNGKLRTAHVGVGGKGKGDLSEMALHDQVEIAAICDVDLRPLNAAARLHPNAKQFRDYREMLTSMKDSIDAVIVSTPDHTHAPASIMAMNLGKHVYCQKPLTHNVAEARHMRLLAEKTGLVTQMGIQIHAWREYRMAVQMLQSGVIGKVRSVHAWSAKSWGRGKPITGSDPVPEYLDWNLWLGCAAERPYKDGVYHPNYWRGLLDFGCGSLGDMGPHIFDTPYGALELTAPLWVKNTCREPNGFGHSGRNVVEYEFPATKYTDGNLRWTWYDGRKPAQRDEDIALPEGWGLPTQGAIFVGENGRMLLPHIAGPRLFPEEKFKDYKTPKLKANDHYHQWVDTCLGKDKCGADFTYSGKLTEAALLGVAAAQLPNTKLIWDAENMQFTNESEANKFLKRDYRDGFGIPGLG